MVACSVDSKYTHLAWIKTPRDKGGLGDLNIPLLSDITKQISRDYGVLLEDEGISLRSVIMYWQEYYMYVHIVDISNLYILLGVCSLLMQEGF